MPGFNRKGPQGEGPMTGRKRGRCANKSTNSDKSESNSQNAEKQSLKQNEIASRGLGIGRGLRNRNASGRGLGCRS